MLMPTELAHRFKMNVIIIPLAGHYRRFLFSLSLCEFI